MIDFDYGSLVQEYEAVQPVYERLAGRTTDLLRRELRAAGFGSAEVSGRAKEIDSFAKKAIRKGYSDPMKQIGDKAGVRIVIPFSRDRKGVEECAEKVLVLRDRDDKRNDLGANKLGYLGVHFQALIRSDGLRDQDADLTGAEVELQIQTRAESAWAVAGHDSLYKAVVSPSDQVARIMMRLIGHAEIFDDEAELFLKALQSQVGFDVLQALVPPLDRELLKMTTRDYDSGITGMIVPPVAALYGLEPGAIYPDVLSVFIEDNRDELARLYRDYAQDARASPLLFQPEAFMLFERLEQDRFRLREVWPPSLPLQLLDEFGAIRGTPLS